jgi:ABC-type sugar transport system ATPase subunit
LLRRRPASLSGGERQRVAIGRAVARRPAVLLLDEPFSSLDLPLRAALRRELVDLHEAFRPTLVHVTHDQGEALGLGRRIAVLDRGRLIQTAAPRELYDRPASPAVAAFVGSPPMNLLPCTLVREAGTTWAVVGEDRRALEDGESPAVLGERESRPMRLGIRPEHLQVHAEQRDLAIRSRIRRVEFQGDSALLTLDLAGSTAVARVASSADFQKGQVVSATLDFARAAWFSA